MSAVNNIVLGIQKRQYRATKYSAFLFEGHLYILPSAFSAAKYDRKQYV